MKNSVYLYLISFFSLFFVACGGGENHESSRDIQPSDTIYTEKSILSVYGSDSERALTMIDSGLLLGTLDEDLATLLRAKVYCYSPNEWPLDTVNQMLEGLLESDFAQKDPDNRQNVLDLLVYASRRRGDNVAYLRWATEKADFCRQRGEETEALRTEAEIGAILTSMGEVEKGLSKLDGVIGSLDNQRHFNEMDACIIALKRRIYVLCDIDRYNEVIPLAKHMVEKLNDYREHPDDYDDGSFRLPSNEDKRLDYCDFYTSQAYGFLMIAYGDLGTLDSSRYYLALFEKSNYSNTLVGKMMLSSAYLRLGQYGKVQPLYDEIEARMGADTLNSDYALLLRGRAIMAEAAGNYYAANNYGKRYNNLKETLNKQLLESRAHEYAARYHLQEEQAKVVAEQHKAESRRKVVIVLGIFGLFAIIFIVQLLIQRRIISHKNKVLSDQIAKYMNAKHSDSMIDTHSSFNDDVDDNQENDQSEINALSDDELFTYISDYISTKKRFLDPSFNRDMLVNELKINKNRVGAAFSKGSDYDSMNDYIRNLRIEYSCQLLTECPDLSINDIAAASGFANSTIYGRIFKDKYNVSPSTYRSLGSDNI